jgi:anaerobic magnesium-protoporphyrin IX monomethyl ester cyclase
MNRIKILLIEPPGGFIRLDRCMQSINSWGGVYRFPLNLCRIAGHLLSLGYDVRFIDLQADKEANLERTLTDFHPDVCILSCGYPSMREDAKTARRIKEFLPNVHVSTFGVVPTALEHSFYDEYVWQFKICFDSIIVGGEPALGYEELLTKKLQEGYSQLIWSEMQKEKSIQTYLGRKLFNASLYRSPFTGAIQTYIEASYGCPHSCNFCVVNQLYGGKFAKRSPEDIVNEVIYVVENYGVEQFSLWDEGTTFQRSQIQGICRGLIELKKSKNSAFRNLTWNTRSTTDLLNEETVILMKQSGMTGITLGLESFDELVLSSTGKGTSVANNNEAIRLLREVGIISIGHIPLGLPLETRESADITIQAAIDSKLDVLQVYCAVPYPGTDLYEEAMDLDLIRVSDLTQYELCNPIMDTICGISYLEIGEMRKVAMNRFYSRRELNLKMLNSKEFAQWANR